MNKDLLKKNNEELSAMCTNLVEQMEAYMSNDLDCNTVQSLKDVSMDAVFEIQSKISEMDGTYGLLDSDDPHLIKEHANLVELLLGTLEQLKEIFSKQ